METNYNWGCIDSVITEIEVTDLILTVNSDLEVCEGENFTITSSATGNGNINYNWNAESYPELNNKDS